MKNIFSKTTEKRTQDGVKTDSKRTNYGIRILIFAFLSLGFGQAWGVDYYFRHWDANNSTQLVDQGSNIYSSYFILNGNISFKISDASWTSGNTFGKNSSAISLNSEYSCASPGSDFSLNFATNRAYLVRLNASGSTKKLLISTFVPSTAAPSAVVSGTNAMFYIQGYEGLNYLVNSSSTKASNSYPMNYTGISYVNTAKTNLSSYDRISNNPGGWNGDEATNIKTATGGELITRANVKTAAKTAATTTSVSGDVLSISTTTNATTGVYGNLPLYIQYYIDNSFAGVTYNASTASYGSIPAGGATARASTYDVSSLTNGSHTLKTVLTDGIIYWVADEDNFNVAHTYSITYKDQGNVDYSGSNSGSLPSNYTYGVGASLVPGEKAGYSFGGWYTATDCSSGLTTTISSSATGNKTFYAKWTLEPGVTLSAASATLNIGQTVRLTATGSNASNITKYDFYEGSTKIGTVSTSATSATYDYTPTTTGSKTMKVIMTYNSGSSTIESSTVGLSINTPSVATLTEASSTTEMWIGENPTGALTFSATSNNVGSGASVTWSISDASSGTFTQTSAGSYSGKSWKYTPVSTGSKTITVTMTVGGNNYTKTYNLKVYERWNIYVHNNCKWAGGVALYMWNGSGSNAVWPGAQGTGTGCEIYNGNWYVVTLDSKYDNFILDNNQASSGIEQCDDATMSKVTYAPDTFWEFIYRTTSDGKKLYKLTAASLSDPTVVLDAGESTSYVINTNQIYFTGHITNYGGDGSAAADMIEVGFELNGTKYPMTCKDGDDKRFFWGYVTGLTAGTTYTVKAYATNIHGTGKSSGTSFTTRAAGTTTIKVRSAVGRTAPYIYAYTETDAGCNGTTTYNAAAPGVAMTKVITGTVYNWYEYSISNEFNKFRISENGSNKTDDWECPTEATCYYYHPTEATQGNRLGTMACPSAIPQLMINGGGSSEEFTYYDMSSGGVNQITKTLSLAAKTGYLFKPVYNAEWYGKASTNITRAANSVNGLDAAVEDNLYMTTDAAGDYTFTFNTSTKAITITYPTAYTIIYGAGTINGSNSAISVSPSFDSGDYVLAETDVTVSKGTTKTGYTWKGWYSNAGGTGEAWSTTDANLSLTATRTGNINVYACYTYTNYTITYNLNGGSNPVSPAPATSYTIASSTITLPTPTRTGYTFGGWKINSNLSGDSYTTIPSGSTGNKVYYAKWTPKNYTVTLHEQEATTSGTPGDGGTITMTYDATTNIKDGVAAIQIITSLPIKTGYEFDGYWNSDACNDKQLINATGYYNWNVSDYIDGTTNTWVHADDVDLYAKWTPKQSALTFDYQTSAEGYGAEGTLSAVSATYGAAMPALSGSMPTAANGYCFMGFFSETGGNGTKYYNADKSSAHNWDVDTESGTTLYAYYKKAEITGITFTPGNIVAPGATVSVTATIEPTPVGPTTICWRVLYSNDNPLDPQPTFTPVSGAIVSFPAHSASGSYKVEATLRKGTGCGGEEIHTFTAPFQVAGDHTVTVQYKCGNTTIAASTTTTGRPLVWSSAIAAPEIFGYTFHHWLAGDGITLSEDGTNAKTGERADSSVVSPIYIKAIYDGKLTAVYTQNNIIYFKNTLGWENVFVNFYTGNAWNNDNNGSGSPKGCGNSGVTHRNKEMTRIGDSDVWYYDYGYNGGGSSITPSLYVSFTGSSRPSVSEFWGANPGINVVYPANYADAIATDKSSENGFKAATPMFVPISQDPVAINVGSGGKANYYNAGYWTTYTPGTGYTLEIYNDAGSLLLKSIEFTSEDDLMPMKAVADLEAGKTYKYQIRRGGTGSAGVYYGNKSTMTYKDHGQTTAWSMTNTMDGGFKMCGITTNAAGDYTFKLSYSGNNSNPVQYRLRMEVDYPIASGDYRVIYTDNTRTGWKESAIITQANNAKDTVSFFIRPGSSPKMNFQQATVNGETGVITWDSIDCVATATLKVLPKDSVYNVCLTMDGSGAISLENIEGYTGNFYIRTDAANSKWDNYRSDPDHLMTYSEYSITHGGYSHYYCHWVTTADAARKNVKFCIANDYSPCISDTLTRETASGEWANINSFIDANGNLLRSANVRFMWNQHDNTIKRAYLDPAKNDDNFLVLASADSKIADKNKTVQTSVVFSDNENWIYEANVKAKPNAQIKLKATWGDATTIVQYFKGTESTTESLITGSGSDWYDIRLIYDYKTNRLIAAMLPSGNHTSVEPINADVMFIREHQGDISQVTFTEDGALTDIKIAYGVMRFNKWTLNNKDKDTHSPLASPASPYERAMYFISFPFEVKLSEVFGIGNYGQDWIVEYYDGAERARTGWWEGEPGFWRYVWNRKDFVLKPNVGYLLQLELASFGEESSAWDNDNERLELFFPSSGNLGTITNTTVNCTIPEHACTINRAATEGLPDTPKNPHTSYNRTIFDSHWNVMSVPTYVNATPNDWSNTTWTTKIGPKFLYTWNPDDNTLTATSGKDFEYHAMHAYMVQYGGNIQWVTSSTSPASIVARDTYAEQPKEIEFRIEIQQNEKMVDQTFVIMSNDDEINANFQFGEDMSKDFNARNANIYTMTADNVAAAGNSLPMSETTTIVPVGVSVKKNGDYTFAIPEGTEGIGVTLVDNETGVRTSLSALDYTVTLQPGDYTGRFVLEISPIAQTPTGVETVTGEGLPVTGVRKVMIDGILYIVKDGKMYDARGARVQ